MPETVSNKNELRRALLAERQAIAAEVRKQWDSEIAVRLIAWWDAHQVRSLGVYWPIRSEPDLRQAYTELSARGVQLALPVVVDNDSPLKFIAWRPGDPTTKDAFGVAIPVSGEEIQPEALLIPCVGFNALYYRLGYGGGFYDRTLAQSPRPRTVGVGYSCGFAAFDADSHDVALDAVITEKTSIELN
ncbi:MAG TPA: 5-formyltetrahydrofolate cyclo-ligase [Noviherbaspirillum sp.]|nr:5-formyltetrahydrofolate cyclo-ligase [Noviherbaspirillum sp.]